MNTDKEILFERTYDAPLQAVWQAWTDPEMLKQWWGPEGVTVPECELDVRMGGKIHIVMEGGDQMGQAKGMRWPMEGEFTTVEEATKLSYTAKSWVEGQQEATEVDQTAELNLSDESGKTKMQLKVTITKVGPNAGSAPEGMQWGYNQQFTKLEGFLAK